MVAKEALDMLRTLDSFGRVAANEFAIVMPTTWLDQSLKAIARLKKRVAGCDWNAVAPGLQVTFSTGLTTNAIKDTADIMLARATSALHKPKPKAATASRKPNYRYRNTIRKTMSKKTDKAINKPATCHSQDAGILLHVRGTSDKYRVLNLYCLVSGSCTYLIHASAHSGFSMKLSPCWSVCWPLLY
jgi:hypothetical protein